MLDGDCPTWYQRMTDKAKRFEADGYECLIAAEFGNKNSAKLGKVNSSMAGLLNGSTGLTAALPGERRDRLCDVAGVLAPDVMAWLLTESSEVNGVQMAFNELLNDPKRPNKVGGFDPELYKRQLAVIRSCAVKHQNFEATVITSIANNVFSKKGWETVSVGTIKGILNEFKPQLAGGRRGKKVYESEYAMQIKRKAPAYPLFYWTLDGWTVELAYRIPGPNGGSEIGRFVVVVVLDPFNKYPAGFAIGDRETPELIRQAQRNAMIHIKDLLGDHYRPWQLQSDNYQIKNLTEFYQAMTKLFIPAKVGNSKGKVIEPYFGYLNDHYCRGFDNWTGHNVDASKKNQVNSEFSDKIKGTFPDKKGVINQITAIINYERKQKRDEFLAKWAELPAEEKVVMGEVEWMEVFGEPIGKTNVITGQGLQKQIDGQVYVWDSFDPEFRNNRHKDWQVICDRYDYSRALAKSLDGKKKFVLHEKRVLPMDARSHSAEDWQYLKQVKQYNAARRSEILEMYADDAALMKETLTGLTYDDQDFRELQLKMMWTNGGQQKEGIQDAKGLKNGSMAQVGNGSMAGLLNGSKPDADSEWEERQMAFLRSQTNISEYADL